MSWIKERTPEESLKVLRTLSQVCADLGGPVAKELNTLVQTSQFDVLLDYKFDYESSKNLEDLIYSRQIQALFSKAVFLPIPDRRRSTAVSRFVESELRCLEANRTIDYHRRKPLKTDPLVTHALLVAGQKIDSVLGSVPHLEDLSFAFGPGANTNVKGAVAMPRAKLSAKLVCSERMLPAVSGFLEEVPHWCSVHAVREDDESYVVPVSTAPGKLLFVPKNARTDRAIVVEPLLNSFFQKGVGDYIKARLAFNGINLRDQSINQRLAQMSSMSDNLATVDFSMASDCIAVEAVHLLLSPEWAEFLDSLRTGEVSIDERDIASVLNSGESGEASYLRSRIREDRTLRLEKFSSMGNGFTFELESVIFYGLAHACIQITKPKGSSFPPVSVFGDDVILPSYAYPLFSKVCSFIGLAVNTGKSYVSGPFRESCGSDWFLGSDIRPFYQKDLVSDRTLYTAHNWFVRHGEHQLAAAIIPLLSKQTSHLYGPDGYGDGHLIGDFPHRLPRHMKRAGYGGSVFETYTLKPRRIKTPMLGDKVLPLYSVYTRSGERDATDPDVVRGSRGYAKIQIYTLRTRIL